MRAPGHSLRRSARPSSPPARRVLLHRALRADPRRRLSSRAPDRRLQQPPRQASQHHQPREPRAPGGASHATRDRRGEGAERDRGQDDGHRQHRHHEPVQGHVVAADARHVEPVDEGREREVQHHVEVAPGLRDPRAGGDPGPRAGPEQRVLPGERPHVPRPQLPLDRRPRLDVVGVGQPVLVVPEASGDERHREQQEAARQRGAVPQQSTRSRSPQQPRPDEVQPRDPAEQRTVRADHGGERVARPGQDQPGRAVASTNAEHDGEQHRGGEATRLHPRQRPQDHRPGRRQQDHGDCGERPAVAQAPRHHGHQPAQEQQGRATDDQRPGLRREPARHADGEEEDPQQVGEPLDLLALVVDQPLPLDQVLREAIGHVGVVAEELHGHGVPHPDQDADGEQDGDEGPRAPLRRERRRGGDRRTCGRARHGALRCATHRREHLGATADPGRTFREVRDHEPAPMTYSPSTSTAVFVSRCHACVRCRTRRAPAVAEPVAVRR